MKSENEEEGGDLIATLLIILVAVLVSGAVAYNFGSILTFFALLALILLCLLWLCGISPADFIDRWRKGKI